MIEMLATLVCEFLEVCFDYRMRAVEVGEAKVKVLLVKENDQFYAVGGKCSHYSAPLVKGELYKVSTILR